MSSTLPIHLSIFLLFYDICAQLVLDLAHFGNAEVDFSWRQGSVAGKCNEPDLPNTVKCTCVFKKGKHPHEGLSAASFKF